eukprot:IDg3120t1
MAIQEKGRRLLERVNENMPPNDKVTLMFSNGWLQGFQCRNNFKSHKSHGEAGDADDAAIVRELPHIHEKLSKKKQKARMTFLACANADGSGKFPMMIIGRARRPRCFQKKTGQDLGFDYWHNSKAWMTSVLFYGWLERFDNFIGQTPGRKVALLLDNCSAHGKPGTLPVLNNVEIIFLPPNTTSKVQPMDAGVIACVKMRYRRFQISRALDSEDRNTGDVYKVNQLLAMKWIQSVWDGLEPDVIRNCWRNTGVIAQGEPTVL